MALLLLPSLAGCSGTRFGEALSNSFSGAAPATPPDSTARTTDAPTGASSPAPAGGPAPQAGSGGRPAAGGSATTASGAPSSATPGGVRPAGATVPRSGAAASRPAAAPAPAGAGGSPATATPPISQPARPAPYRVTILLPQADAAAPAEVVTQALRSAGVPFEVETIERLGRATAPATPQAPASRPAPEPR